MKGLYVFFFPDKIIEIMCLFFFVSLFFLLGYAEGKILAVNRQIKKLYLFNTSPSKENKEEKKTQKQNKIRRKQPKPNRKNPKMI